LPFDILLVEDNPADVDLARYAVLESGLNCRLHATSGMPEAMAFLMKQSPYAQARDPSLVVMDWNLVRHTGLDLLNAIRKLPGDVSTVPVVVFSSSLRPADVHAAYVGGANCWINKGINLEEFTQAIVSVIRFWSEVATLPL